MRALVTSVLLMLEIGISQSIIVEHSQNQMALLGSDVRLSCRSDMALTSCGWILPSGKECLSLQSTKTCRSDMKIHYIEQDEQDSKNCQIEVRDLDSTHSGNFKCLINDRGLGEEKVIKVVVSKPPEMAFTNNFGDVYVNAGEEIEFECEAIEAFPKGNFEWTMVDKDGIKHKLENENPIDEKIDQELGLVDASQKLKLAIKKEIDGNNLFCRYVQMDMDGHILFPEENSVSIRLGVLYVEFLDDATETVSVGLGHSMILSTFVTSDQITEVKHQWEVKYPDNPNPIPIDQEGHLGFMPTQLLARDGGVYEAALTKENMTMEEDGAQLILTLQRGRKRIQKVYIIEVAEEIEGDAGLSVGLIVLIVILVIILDIILLVLAYVKKMWCFSSKQDAAATRYDQEGSVPLRGGSGDKPIIRSNRA